jgi:Holliday junction resolvase RusA-like endonuclease
MIELILDGQIVPKARPRVTVNGAYMPPKYRQWKQGAILDLSQQHQGHKLTAVRSIDIVMTGKHSRRGDLDNISGSILDALVQSGVLVNDNLTVVPRLSIELMFDKTEPKTLIKIEV